MYPEDAVMKQAALGGVGFVAQSGDTPSAGGSLSMALENIDRQDKVIEAIETKLFGAVPPSQATTNAGRPEAVAWQAHLLAKRTDTSTDRLMAILNRL